MSDQEAAFQAALDEDPSRSDVRLVFADYLEEQGDVRAAGMRWLGENRRRPQQTVERFYLYDEKSMEESRIDMDPQSNIPREIFRRIPDIHGRSVAKFASRREAEDTFCAAFIS